MTPMHEMTMVAEQLDESTPLRRYRLQVAIESYSGPAATRTLTVERELVIGRDDKAGLTLDGGLVSRRHVLVRAVEEGLEIEDVSSNGTLVDGVTVRRASVRAGNECTLDVGSFRLWLRLLSPSVA
jgi:pSer/pThr/pTyr-binding forkhead associated (FHA) protein